MRGPQYEANRLIYKALQLGLTPTNDPEYRELLSKYRADAALFENVQQAASALELTILDASEHGLIIAPSRRESRFSLRLSDLRQQLNNEQKVALVLAHLAISATFYPTTDLIEDDTRTPLSQESPPEGTTEEFVPALELLRRLPVANPRAERASTNSIEGFVKLALKQMAEYGLVRLVRETEEEAQALYTPTHRLRIHLRELTLWRLFELAQQTMQV
jgi:hypothetical protein